MADVVQRELFTERRGAALEATAGDGGSVALRIERVEDFGRADGVRFSVFLTGPGDRLLPQGVYRMTLPGEEAFDLFIVPIGREQDRFLYEAAVNREGG